VIQTQNGLNGIVALNSAITAGQFTSVFIKNVIKRPAIRWLIDLHITGTQLANAFAVAMIAALAAGVYPAWRAARAPLASDIREE
jgi:putative ABC transport system permease protein